mmetsp:Transcript_5652/g.6153  ORF Transcript_5652/g.6153 Transcript_5652/m.6153 type:complete len:123 (+) Transcript_5652:83-451(+)
MIFVSHHLKAKLQQWKLMKTHKDFKNVFITPQRKRHMLNNLFDADGIEKFHLYSAMTNQLMYGNLLWEDQVNPSGLASSVITSEDLITTDILHKGMVLDLKIHFEMSASSTGIEKNIMTKNN